MSPERSTFTVPPLPPAQFEGRSSSDRPAQPPTEPLITPEPLPVAPASVTLKPPLPPPLPTDCAKTPLELAPSVWIRPVDVTWTALPSSPAPPDPPIESDAATPFAVLATTVAATLNPPSPPPPPTDSAK